MPLFTIPDISVKTSLLVNIILGACGAEVDPSANYVGWGSDISPSVFRPLKQGDTVSVSYDNLINMSVENHSLAEEAC